MFNLNLIKSKEKEKFKKLILFSSFLEIILISQSYKTNVIIKTAVV